MTGNIKNMRKQDEELVKGWGQIVTPLEIKISDGFKTTENYYHSMPSVVDYSYPNSYIMNLINIFYYSVNQLVTICNQLKLPSSGGNYCLIELKKLKKSELTC